MPHFSLEILVDTRGALENLTSDMRFEDIPGKSDVKNQLRSNVQRGRIPHAQIFLGREGSGALPLAMAFAAYILCENRSETDSCGQCRQCLKSYKLIHPDLHFSFPVVKSGDKKRADTTSDDFLPQWRDMNLHHPYSEMSEWLQCMGADQTQPNINVKECNDIMHKLNMMSYESDNKILIMWQPEYLGNEGNRLLKLIEEPTEKTYLILVATNQEAILQTILSRCQLVKVPPFDSSEISEYLQHQLQLPAAQAEQIANLSDGNMQYALQVGKNEASDYSDLLIAWLRVAYKSDPAEINQWIAAFSELSKDEQKNFLHYGLHFFRQYLWLTLVQGDKAKLTAKEIEIASRMHKLLDFELAEKLISLLENMVSNLPRNVNVKIMLFADSLQMGEILRQKKSA